MNLHDIRSSPPPLPSTVTLTWAQDEDEDDGLPTCPDCGSNSFRRAERSMNYDRHRITFQTNHYPREDWDTRDSEFWDAEDWECDDCGITLPIEVADAISDSL